MPDDERRDEASKSTKTGSKVLFPEFVRNGFAGAASGGACSTDLSQRVFREINPRYVWGARERNHDDMYYYCLLCRNASSAVRMR